MLGRHPVRLSVRLSRVVVLLVIAWAGVVHAQPDPEPPPAEAPAPAPVATISVDGRVIDSLGRAVKGATITIEGSDATTTTDKLGKFHLDNIPIGASIVIDAKGFETGLGTATKRALDDIVLLTDAQASEVINVEGEAPPVSPGAAKLDRTEMARIPGTGGDLVRTLTIMPGIVNTQVPTGFGGVVIRGSAPEDSKILIDGFEVPLLYHAIGLRAIVPTEAIEKLDYIPGGFDVQWGRASSGLVSLTTRAGADVRSEQAEISVIDGGLVVQGAAGPDVRYMFAIRRSTIDLILPYILPSSLDLSLTTVPRYYDEQARVDYRINDKWKLAVSSIGSDDLLELFADKAENPDKRFYDRTRFIRLTGSLKWHDGPWSATLATSLLDEQFDFEIGALQFIKLTTESSTTRAEVTHTEKEVGGLTDVVMRAGAEAAIGHADIDLALPAQPRAGMMTQFNPKDTSNQFDGTVWTPDFAAWTALTFGISPDIRVTTGLRMDAFARGGDVSVQPRGELQWKLAPKTTLRLSAGAYTRPPENQNEYLHADLNPERATQTIAGLEYEPQEGVRIQTSVYYTDRSRLIEEDANGVLQNSGTGTTYGAEILGTLRQGPWFVWLTTTLSHSTIVDGPGSVERLFQYDQPINMNAAVSWKKGKWQLGGRFELYSGLPETPVVGAVFNSDANLYIPIFGKVYSDRAPIHHQLDLRIDRSWHSGPVLMTFFIDVQNVYLDQSITNTSYSYDYSQPINFKSLPIIPSIGLRGVL